MTTAELSRRAGAHASHPGGDLAPAPEQVPAAGKAALRAGVVGNWVDNIHVFLPLTALAPALVHLAGPGATASVGALVVVAMLLGRPLGAVVFGRLSDRLGRTRTTRVAIAGTAACALAIACLPTHELAGPATLVLLLALRLVGGVFVAGEYSAAIPLAMEWSAPRRRGLMGGLILSMAPWAQASIAFATAGMLAVLGPEAYSAWGWRLLFALGAAASGGMFVYYHRHVVDSPDFHRARVRQCRTPAGRDQRRRPGLGDLLAGRWAGAFWQCFAMMTGLWLLTDSTVLILTSRLATDTGLSAGQVGVVMGLASVAQALAMAVCGHLSTLVGRRRLLVAWGLVAAGCGPVAWHAAMSASTVAAAALAAGLLQVVTVAAYGPVAAYLSERFPTHLRSTGYGSAYSLSLIAPALYPFYLPVLEGALGREAGVLALVVTGGLVLSLAVALGPALTPADLEARLDDVAEGAR